MSAPFPSAMTAARTGQRIAWVFDLKGERNVWVADGPTFAARQVTHYQGDEGQPIASLTLTPDGKTALYARGTETNGAGGLSANPQSLASGIKQQVFAVEVDASDAAPRLLGEIGCPEEDCEDIQPSPDGKWAVWAAKKHLWMAPVDGHEKAKQLFELQGDSNQPRWSPDGKELAFVSDRGDHSFIGIYTVGGPSLRYLAPSTNRDSMPRWSPDGRQIAFVRIHGKERGLPLLPDRPEPWSIMVAEAASGSGKEVWHSGQQLADSLPGLTEDNSFFFAADGRLVFSSEQDGRNHLYSVSTGGGTPTALTPGDFDVEYVAMNTAKTEIVYSSNQGDIERRHLWQVSAGGGKPRPLSSGDSMENHGLFTGDGKYVVCVGAGATSPLMPYLLENGTRRMLAPEQFPKDFPSDQMVTPKVVTFQSEDGLTIHGQLFVPRNVKSGAPALIFTHGGPIRQMMPSFHYMWYYHNAYAQNQRLASMGYVVLSVNYRLGIMYGRAFREAPNSSWRGASEYKDVLASAHYLQSLPYVDKGRIGLWGGSYGGYLTALGLARDSSIFKAGVDYHGVHDWAAFLPHWESDINAAPDLKQARALAFKSSPAADAKTWRSPVLFIHGDDDRNVPFDQTTDMVEKIRPNGVRFEELIFPDEIHDLLRWNDWVQSYNASAEFFARELK